MNDRRMRRFLSGRARPQAGVVATETAFLIPVVLIGCMLFFELARMLVMIHMGSSALEATMASVRRETPELYSSAGMEVLIRQRMAVMSHGYLQEGDIFVQVQDFHPLLPQPGQAVRPPAPSAAGGVNNAMPLRSINVDVRKRYATPLPMLLTLGQTFRYRYRQVLEHVDDGQDGVPVW